MNNVWSHPQRIGYTSGYRALGAGRSRRCRQRTIPGRVLPPLCCKLPIATDRQPSNLQWVSARCASLPMILLRMNAELDEPTDRPSTGPRAERRSVDAPTIRFVAAPRRTHRIPTLRPNDPPISAHMRYLGSRSRAAHIESRMSRSLWVGWTGLGWATPCGGQARIRSHRPWRVWWVGSTGHYEDIARGRVSRILGQTPPTISSRLQVFEDLAGNVAFQAAHDLWGV